MTLAPNKKICANIEKQLEALHENDEELRFILTSAEAKLEQFCKSKRYNSDIHGMSIESAAAADESTAAKLAMAVADFAFLQSWTVGEFASFMEAHSEYLKLKKPRKKRGRPRKTQDDIANQHRQYEQQILQVHKGVRYNMMTGEYQYLKVNPETGQLFFYSCHGDDLNLLGERMLLQHGIRIPDETATKIFKILAKDNPYYPQVEMLDMARARFQEMTLEEAHEFMEDIGVVLFGMVEDEPKINGNYLRNVAIKKFLVSMANLARNPGVTPQWMPILVGGQGCGKSAFCKFIIPQEFKSITGEIKTSVAKIRDEAYRLHTAFIIEFPEVDSQLDMKNIEAMKNLVTGEVDECRRPYAALPEKLVRQFAFIGTTNREDLFAEGAGQRRYVPIQCPYGHEIPWHDLRDTDLVWKIWAAADIIAHTFSNEDIYVRAWTREEEAAIFGWQNRYTQTDPLEHSIINWVSTIGRQRFTTSQLLEGVNLDIGRLSPTAASRRISDILQKHYGACAKKCFIYLPGGKKVRGWEIITPAGDEPVAKPSYSLETLPLDEEHDF